MKWNWGVGVAASYIVFAAATSGFVVFAMSRPVSLVRADYYAESLREDQDMAARARAQQLGSALSISISQPKAISITVPRDSGPIGGTVTLYRASDPAADRTFTFAPDDRGTQVFDVAALGRGHWIVQLKWTDGGREYYVDQAIVLP